MKNKLLASFVVLVVLAIAGFAQSYTGPINKQQNFKQSKTEYNAVAFENGDGREWLIVKGNSRARTIDEQWGPAAIVIESSREPTITKTDTGWEIRFK